MFHKRRDHTKLAIMLVILALTNWAIPPTYSRSRPSHSAKATERNISDARPQSASEAFGQLPLSFEANRGQTDSQVKFLSRGPGYTLFLTATEAVLALQSDKGEKLSGHQAEERMPAPSSSASGSVLRMKLLGANPAPEVIGVEEQLAQVNYFIGRDSHKWQQNVPIYAKVQYQAVYPGVDLIYYGNQRQLEYDFIISPGADPKKIQLAFAGADKLEIADSGELLLHTPVGEVRQHKPLIYQEVDGRRVEVAGGYVLDGGRHVSFRVGAYDANRPLVIDPVLVYSTYLGGSGSDHGGDIAVDTAGNIYITGTTSSLNFPIASSIQPALAGSNDAFIAKLNPAGTALLYSTYFGDRGNDNGLGITVDGSGNAYMTGAYATTGMFPDIYDETQILVVKLSATGSLIYGVLFGNGDNIGYAIAVNSAGYAYVTGHTIGSDFPVTANACQPTWGGFQDGFLSILNPAGTALVYSTYLGGGLNDEGRAIALDGAGYVYVTGGTMADFPTTPGAFQQNLSGFGDAFVVKINSSLSGPASLIYSTLLGGSGFEVAKSIAVNAAGNAYVTGSSSSSLDFPTTTGAFQRLGGGGNCGTFDRPRDCEDIFVTKLNTTGTGLIYSTLLGGLGNDRGNGIAINSAGNAFVTGIAFAHDFPVLNAVQQTKGGDYDAFVTELNTTGTGLVYSTYLGGSQRDEGSDLALDAAGNAYIIGDTSATNFPTRNPLQSTNRGGNEAFIAKIGGTSAPATLSSVTLNPSSVTGSKTSAGRVTLSAPAPAAGATVTLTSSNTAVATVAISVTVSAGATTANFTVSTKAVTTDTPVTISANYNGVTKTATLTVKTAVLSSLTLSPSTVPGSKTSTGKVTLTGPAPASGVRVTLTDTLAAATVPTSVTVSAGATSSTFTVTTSAVTATQTGTVTASYAGASKSATLNVRPVGVASIALTPNPVVGGNTVTGTVTLEAAAAPGNIAVTLSSSNTAIAKPAATSIIIPAGATSKTFTVSTSRVTATNSASIKATANGIAMSKTLTVNP